MVVGLGKFRTHFDGFAHQYVLIGGTAAFLVLEEAGLDARMTRDLDIVLCVEALDAAFVESFWSFVQAGGYQNQQRSTGRKVFYRFDKPADRSYPARLELFSRNLADLVSKDGSHLTRYLWPRMFPVCQLSCWIMIITGFFMPANGISEGCR